MSQHLCCSDSVFRFVPYPTSVANCRRALDKKKKKKKMAESSLYTYGFISKVRHSKLNAFGRLFEQLWQAYLHPIATGHYTEFEPPYFSQIYTPYLHGEAAREDQRLWPSLLKATHWKQTKEDEVTNSSKTGKDISWQILSGKAVSFYTHEIIPCGVQGRGWKGERNNGKGQGSK